MIWIPPEVEPSSNNQSHLFNHESLIDSSTNFIKNLIQLYSASRLLYYVSTRGARVALPAGMNSPGRVRKRLRPPEIIPTYVVTSSAETRRWFINEHSLYESNHACCWTMHEIAGMYIVEFPSTATLQKIVILCLHTGFIILSSNFGCP